MRRGKGARQAPQARAAVLPAHFARRSIKPRGAPPPRGVTSRLANTGGAKTVGGTLSSTPKKTIADPLASRLTAQFFNRTRRPASGFLRSYGSWTAGRAASHQRRRFARPIFAPGTAVDLGRSEISKLHWSEARFHAARSRKSARKKRGRVRLRGPKEISKTFKAPSFMPDKVSDKEGRFQCYPQVEKNGSMSRPWG